ncbi:hypothetical protein ACN28E_25055 [Archangium lansingense]|uniref:hypothetical protein n=1 Tax=Archangium lansingense TaxID=2995310 RepID=UPI003B804528
MPCPPPPPSPPPTLRQLLEQLAALDPVAAEFFRPDVDELEKRLAAAQEQLAADEESLTEVKADGLPATVDEWCMRSSAASGSRRAVQRLEAAEAAKREMVERSLFLARQGLAAGRVFCRDCAGSGDGELLDGGTSLVLSSCDKCAGTGYLITPM